MTTVECCNPEATCFIKNRYYASCVPPSKLNTTWDGRPLSPGEDIPMDLYPMKEMKGLDSSCEDDTCVMKWEQCGGEGNYTISAQCCEDGTSCIVKVCLSATTSVKCLWDSKAKGQRATAASGITLNN